MLRNGVRTVLFETVCEAIELAERGKAGDGYGLLLTCMGVLEGWRDDEKPHGAELVHCWRRVLDGYAHCYHVARE